MKPGDIILNGNNGGLRMPRCTSVMVILCMQWRPKKPIWSARFIMEHDFDAGEETLRATEKIGVIKESAAEFFERYPRDTYVIMRDPQITPEQAAQGVAKIESLVGKDYDYDFSAGDDDYYCTEIVMEYLEEAKGKENAPIFTTTHEKYPGLLTDRLSTRKTCWFLRRSTQFANDAAQRNFSDNLGAASIIPHLNREVEAKPRLNRQSGKLGFPADPR